MPNENSQPTCVEDLQNQIQLCMMQRQNMDAIFNAVADGIIAFDLQLRISNLNQAAQAMLGYSREEAVGESCLTLLPPTEDRDRFNAIFDSQQEVNESRVSIHNRNNRQLHLMMSTRVLRDDENVAKGLIAILRDVTELEALRSELQQQEYFFNLVGKNHRMQALYQLVQDLSDSDATVLVLGESGTGKELVATAIHGASQRCKNSFVKVNCSALSEGLLESELFGHVKGAFTGAIRDKIGRFEEASGGTLFLDEIGDLSPNVQVKLLRVLQEREIERVGSSETIKVDVRVIAATHQDLQQAIEDGQFREDLYYRLNVMPLELPALRQRKEDIPLLVNHFIDKYNARTRRNIQGIGHEGLELLMDYHWPGNVRELENAIEHAFIKCRGGTLLPSCLPTHLRSDDGTPNGQASMRPSSDKEYVQQVLEECQWNRSDAAERLGMHRSTLWRKMKEWDLIKR
ncbi:MAG TPA: PAS domain-containing protein [Candidatus Handelsmanbacteria bacterium]|nr:PAS domain-containing protein [Candidatus Handelsmanbacteria bacterium]